MWLKGLENIRKKKIIRFQCIGRFKNKNLRACGRMNNDEIIILLIIKRYARGVCECVDGIYIFIYITLVVVWVLW